LVLILKVKCIQQIECQEDYILREFLINDTRRIFHFQYLAWSDHSVPENVRNTLNFIEHVNKVYKDEQLTCKCPVVVHCSAGIGRTGAIILIDVIIDKIKHYGLQCDIDVQKTVLNLRTQRSGMVQTEKQYQFLYIALKEYIDIVIGQRSRVNSVSNRNSYGASSINSGIVMDVCDHVTRPMSSSSFLDDPTTGKQYMNLYEPKNAGTHRQSNDNCNGFAQCN
jgi:protein-tyrosine phosphatase